MVQITVEVRIKGDQPEKELRLQVAILVQMVQGLVLLIVTMHLVDQDQKRQAATTLLEVLDSLQEGLQPDLGLVHQGVMKHQGGRVVDCHCLKMRQLMTTMHLEDLEGREELGLRPLTATMHQVDLEDQVDLGLRQQTATVDLIAQLDLVQKQQAAMMLLVDLEDQIDLGVKVLRHQGTILRRVTPIAKPQAGKMGIVDHRPPLGFTLHLLILAELKPLAVIKVQADLELAKLQASPDNLVEATEHQEKVMKRRPVKAWEATMTRKVLALVLAGLALVLTIPRVTMTSKTTMGELCQ